MNNLKCYDFPYIVILLLLFLCMVYILFFLLISYIKATLTHDSISSSISDANDVPKRIVNITIGFLSALMISLYADEYISRIPKNSQNDLWLYILNMLSYLFFVFISIFPGGSAYRSHPNYNKIYDWLHITSSFLTFLLMNICNLIYSFRTKYHVLGWITGLCSAISILSCFAFVAIQSININMDDNGAENNENIPINQENQNDENRNRLNSLIRKKNRFSYLFEILTFVICVFFSVLTSLYRNDDYSCIEHQDLDLFNFKLII